jgi:hypothetical protein
MIKTVMLVLVYNVHTGEVVKLIEPMPGFELAADCDKAVKLLQPARGEFAYRAWCLTPAAIDI